MDKSIALYLFVSFVACVTPGSGVLYTIASGFRGGMKCVLASPLGTCLGCSLMSALSATGLGALIANSPAAYGVLQVVSALVLVWFGLQSWRSGALDLSDAGHSDAREGLGTSPERFTFRKIFWGAVVLQASNIMLIVFLLSLMPPFIRTDQPYLPQAVMLSALLCSSASSFILATAGSPLPAPSVWPAQSSLSGSTASAPFFSGSLR